MSTVGNKRAPLRLVAGMKKYRTIKTQTLKQTRAESLRRRAEDAHPAVAHALRRRASELEFQSWLEDTRQGANDPIAA